MSNIRLFLYIFSLIMAIGCKPKIGTPVTFPHQEVTDTYHNTSIKDPYRNLENVKDTNVIHWLKAQNDFSRNILSRISNRERIIERQTELSKESKFRTTKLRITKNDLYFYLKRASDENVYKLYYRTGINGEEQFLFDPTTYKKDATITYISPNSAGTKIAIAITENDAGIGEMIILDVKTKQLAKEIITSCWPSAIAGISWMKDNRSFIYSHIPVTDKTSPAYIQNTISTIYTIGDDPKKIRPVFSKNNNKDLNISKADFPIAYIKGGNDAYIFGRIGGARNYDDYYYSAFNSDISTIQWKPFYKKEDKVSGFHVYGDSVVFLSAKNSPNFKLCKTSLIQPNFGEPDVLIEEDKNAVITDWAVTKDGIYFIKTKNGVEAKMYVLKNNTIENIKLPKPSGDVSLSSRGAHSDYLSVKTWGWTNKAERYRYESESGTFLRSELYLKESSPELENIEVLEVEVASHDGVLVPLTVIYKKGLELNGTNRLLMTGYGAYGISETPSVGSYMRQWLSEGGVYAIAHVRGGGEKGNAWHKGGYKTTKPNTWKDFIACTEYLINEKYTSPKKIAVMSASAGGILIGRAITERPDLYASAFIGVGILNTLRYEFSPNGKNNIKEFGTVKDSTEFKALFEMDSYQHIEKGKKYPAIYLTAGMEDARVAPWIPAKFAARMQEANASDNPILLSVDFKGGHSMDKSKNKAYESLADILTFSLWQTGHPDYQIN